MGAKSQLKLLNFLQYFIWGAWLITIASYFFAQNWSPSQFGIIYSTIGISAIGFPTFFGFLTDKFFQLEKVYRMLHFTSAIIMLILPSFKAPSDFFWGMLCYMIFYMSTIPMLISYTYNKLKENGFDVKFEYPKIRVWGTIGFVMALWVVSLTKSETTVNQFYISAIASIFLGITTFFISKSKTNFNSKKDVSFLKMIGLDAFDLLFNKKLFSFFILAFFFGIALIVSNGYTDSFIHDLKSISNKSNFIFEYPAIIVSLSQISEIGFILLIPFLFKKYSLKTIIVFSFIAWFLKFLMLYIVASFHVLLLILPSCIFYGIAFDFFIISGSLLIEEQTEQEKRGSAQGFFVMVVNGFGSLFGSFFSGFLIEGFFTNSDNNKVWSSIWLFFAVLTLVVILPYLFFQRYKKNRKTAFKN